MNPNIFVIVSFFLIFISSCNHVKNGEIDFVSNLGNDSIDILDLENPLWGEDSTSYFSNVFSAVSYIPLESTLESTIGNVDKLEISNHGDFIVFDRQNGIIVRFDSLGNFLNHIGYRGHGSKEYIFPRDVIYDLFNDQVIVYDLPKRTLIFYNLSGEFIKKIQVKFVFETFTVVDSTHLVTFSNNLFDAQVSDHFNFRIIGHDGTIVSQYDSYSYDRHNYRPCSDYTFKYQGNRMVCNRIYTPLVFSFDVSGITPSLFLDLGSKQIPEEKLRMYSDIEFSKELRNSEYAYCKSVFESELYYFINVVEKRNLFMYYIPKKQVNQCYAVKRFLNDIYGLVSTTDIKNIKDNEAYFIFDPQYFYQKYQYNLSNSIPMKKEDRDIISRLSEQSNPIIQRCTIR